MTNPKPLKAMTDEELTEHIREVFEEVWERSYDYRSIVQKLVDHFSLYKSFIRLKIGTPIKNRFWDGVNFYRGGNDPSRR